MYILLFFCGIEIILWLWKLIRIHLARWPGEQSNKLNLLLPTVITFLELKLIFHYRVLQILIIIISYTIIPKKCIFLVLTCNEYALENRFFVHGKLKLYC